MGRALCILTVLLLALGCGQTAQEKQSHKIQTLILQLESEDDEVCCSAHDRLVIIGEPAVKPLIAKLGDFNILVSGRAAWVLADIGEPALVPLMTALQDEDEDVRRQAALALGHMGHKAAVNSLIRTLKDKECQVRREAAWALGAIGDERAVGPLVEMVKRNDYYPTSAAEALGRIGEPAVVPLIELLESEVEMTRFCAVLALKEIPDKRAVAPLVSRLKDESWQVREYTAEALGNIGDKRALKPLIDALSDESGSVSTNALRALKKLTSQDFGADHARWKNWLKKKK